MDTTLEKLKKLAKLRDDGVISEEDFLKMKQKLVDEF
ncbi:MAG: SHOCT domain-containing protein [Bacteroidota bacterium]